VVGFAGIAVGIPVAIRLAVLRYRFYDVDVIINRTLVYGLLTAALVAVYFGGVVATQTTFQAFAGQQEQLQLAVVVSTLVIAALFNPLRRAIQSFIDRRFYRRKYDAAKSMAYFSSKLRDETDLVGGGAGDDAAHPRLAVAAPRSPARKRRRRRTLAPRHYPEPQARCRLGRLETT
jgi:hypothetical protein